jgi:hypothetical protein
MTQSLAYRAIRECKLKKREKINRTEANLGRAKAEAEDNFGFIPTEEKIWKSLQSKDLSKQIQYFMWMITHDTYYIGTHWLREGTSPKMQERGICKHCDIPETMQHILSQCEV